MISEGALRNGLAERWGIGGADIRRHDGGLNSATWLVGERWVAKAVTPANRASFVAGLRVARLVDDAGVPTGRPVPAGDGEYVVDVDGFPLALLTRVNGEECRDQNVLGRTLGHVHRVAPPEECERFHWLDPDAPHLTVEPWVLPAVGTALAAYGKLGNVTWGLLHTDPAPDAFRLDAANGVCAVIDWSVAMRGPLLYDLASAVMYAGGPDHARTLIGAYLETGALSPYEVERGLPTLLRMRWAVQADYFARRLVDGDLTGIADAAENEKGLRDAHRAFLSFSARGA